MKPRAVALIGMMTAFVLVSPAPAGAAFLLSFGNATVGTGSTTTVDVRISDPAGVGIDLTSYDFDFRIKRLSGTGDLQFVKTQSLAYRTAANNYVFGNLAFNDSSVVATSGGGTSPNDYGAFQRYTGADSTSDLSDVNVNGSKLLARLQLTTVPTNGVPPTVGSTFMVYYVHQAVGSDYTDGSPGNFSLGGFATITVVPEPCSLVLGLNNLAVAGIATLWVRRKTRS